MTSLVELDMNVQSQEEAVQNQNPANPYGVRVGQVWQSCDKRYRDVNIQIVKIYEDRGYALCLILKNSKFRRIQLKRFRERSNGYRLISIGDVL